ncbi:hypothetical protein JCM11251_007660 [Rhodosporidiobolus azoricus]
MSSSSSVNSKADGAATTIEQPVLDDAEHKKLLRRIDWHFMPWVCIRALFPRVNKGLTRLPIGQYLVTYCIMRIDVGNISNAGVMNSETGHSLRQVLSLTPQQWAWCIACFSYTYGALEPLSTFFIRLTTPSQWIGRIMLSWGIIMCCMTSVSSYGGLVATRVLIGAAEAG